MRNLLMLLFSCLILTLLSCQSNEDKAAKLIKEEMYKTLYDFSSYEPIETIIDSAFTTIYRDSTILLFAYIVNDKFDLFNELSDKRDHNESIVKIWEGSSDNYSLSKYKEALDKSLSNLHELKKVYEEISELHKVIKEKIANFQSTFCGWQAKHKFRCKTKGGNFDLANYLYLFDADLKKITYKENMADEELIKIRDVIDYAIETDLN